VALACLSMARNSARRCLPRWRLKLQLRSHYFTLSLLIFLHLIVHLSHVAVLYLSDPLLSFHLVVSAGPNCSEISP
jgi:hypothetical protein